MNIWVVYLECVVVLVKVCVCVDFLVEMLVGLNVVVSDDMV